MRRGERNFDGRASEISAGGERGRDASGDRGIRIRGNSREGRRRTVAVGRRTSAEGKGGDGQERRWRRRKKRVRGG